MNAGLKAENERLKNEHEDLELANAELKAESKRLKEELGKSKSTNEGITAEDKGLKSESECLESAKAQLIAEGERLKIENRNLVEADTPPGGGGPSKLEVADLKAGKLANALPGCGDLSPSTLEVDAQRVQIEHFEKKLELSESEVARLKEYKIESGELREVVARLYEENGLLLANEELKDRTLQEREVEIARQLKEIKEVRRSKSLNEKLRARV